MHRISYIKDKFHVIISIDAEKVFDKNQHIFMIQTLNRLGIEGTHLNIMMAVTTLNVKKLNSFSSRCGTKQYIFTTLI